MKTEDKNGMFIEWRRLLCCSNPSLPFPLVVLAMK